MNLTLNKQKLLFLFVALELVFKYSKDFKEELKAHIEQLNWKQPDLFTQFHTELEYLIKKYFYQSLINTDI